MNSARTYSRMATLVFTMYFLIVTLTAQAQVLPPNGSVSDSLNATTTQITYAFTAAEDGDATFTITPSAGLNAHVQFFDSDGTTLRFQSGNQGTGNPGSLSVAHLNPETTYYVRANRFGGTGTFTLSNVFAPDVTVNDTEPNDTFDTALSVAMPATRTGHLGYSLATYDDVDRQDWYKFTVPQDGDLTVNLTPANTLNAHIQFYDSNGTSLLLQSNNQGTGNAGSLAVPHLNPGTTYFLKVNHLGGYGGYTLNGVFTAATLTNDAELNDTAGTGILVSMPTTRTGHLGYSRASYNTLDEEDWYKFTVPADGDLTVNLTPTSTLNAHIQFYDSNGATIRLQSNNQGTGNTGSLAVPHLNPGTTYFLKIHRFSGYGSYTIACPFVVQGVGNDSEPNNTFDIANLIAMPTIRQGHLGYSRTSYNDIDPEDWYKFDVPQDGDLIVTLVPTNLLNAHIQFYDSNGTSLQLQTSNQGTGNTNVLTIPHLNPETDYFLRLNQLGGYGGYEMIGRFRPQFIVNDLEPNSTPAEALSVASFSGQTGHLGYSRTSYDVTDNFDYYRFTHPGGSLSITLVPSIALNAHLQMLASNGTSLVAQTNNQGTGNPATLNTSQPAGEYFLRVTWLNGYGGYGLNPLSTISISGNIELEDCVGPSQPVTIEVRPETGDPFIFNEASGSFSLTGLPRQRYNVAFKGAKWLRLTEIVEGQVGDVFIVNAFLRTGDANDDNSVDVLDLDILLQTFDRCLGDAGYDSRADFNCDDCADVLDLDLVLRNFDRVGED